MKKFFLVLVAFALVAGVATAQTVVSAGFELGFGDLSNAGDTMGITLFAEYESDELAENLDFYARLGIPVNLDPLVLWLELELDIGYNLSEAMIAGLYGQFDVLDLVGDGEVEPYLRHLKPYFQYTHGLDFGDIYAKFELPFSGLNSNQDLNIGLDFYLGTNMANGFGFQVGVLGNHFGLPEGLEASFFEGILQLLPSFTTETLYAYLEVDVPLMSGGMDWYGLTLKPGVEAEIAAVEGLTVFGEIPISYVGAKKDTGMGKREDVPTIGLTIGAKMSF